MDTHEADSELTKTPTHLTHPSSQATGYAAHNLDDIDCTTGQIDMHIPYFGVILNQRAYCWWPSAHSPSIHICFRLNNGRGDNTVYNRKW